MTASYFMPQEYFIKRYFEKFNIVDNEENRRRLEENPEHFEGWMEALGEQRRGNE